MAHSILIVDDSPLIRRYLRRVIEQSGEWQVCGEAENGKIAVERSQSFDPTL
jgi:chemotaxis response regulator CheB